MPEEKRDLSRVWLVDDDFNLVNVPDLLANAGDKCIVDVQVRTGYVNEPAPFVVREGTITSLGIKQYGITTHTIDIVSSKETTSMLGEREVELVLGSVLVHSLTLWQRIVYSLGTAWDYILWYGYYRWIEK